MPKLTMPCVLPGLHDLLIEAALVIRRHPDFIAEVAGIGDAVDQRRHVADIHGAVVHELEGGVGDILVGQLLQNVARFRPGDGEADQAHVIAVDAAPSHRWADAARTSACDISAPGWSPTCRSVSLPALAMVKSPISLPAGIEHRREDEAARPSASCWSSGATGKPPPPAR